MISQCYTLCLPCMFYQTQTLVITCASVVLKCLSPFFYLMWSMYIVAICLNSWCWASSVLGVRVSCRLTQDVKSAQRWDRRTSRTNSLELWVKNIVAGLFLLYDTPSFHSNGRMLVLEKSFEILQWMWGVFSIIHKNFLIMSSWGWDISIF